jgi:cytidylate kinase
MSVITITGQVGAGEEELAKATAEALNYELLERPLFEEILKEYGVVEYDKLLDSPPHFFDGLTDQKQNVNDLMNSMYLFFAKRNNCVIVSRRAFLVLDPFINVMNVFVKAPLSARIDAVMKQEKVDDAKALDLIREQEKIRSGIVEAFHNRRWDSLDLWSLIADSRKFGIPRVADMIIEANREVVKNDDLYGWQDGMPTTDTIDTDPVLEKTITRVLERLGDAGEQEV